MARIGGYPSDEDVAACAAAYQVPEGSEPHRFMAQSYIPKTLRRVTIHVVELTWQDISNH